MEHKGQNSLPNHIAREPGKLPSISLAVERLRQLWKWHLRQYLPEGHFFFLKKNTTYPCF